jgi:peptide/nickel transport system substrate-binding protein
LGPFKFVEYIEGERIVYERFDNWWQKDLPYLDRIIYKIIPTPESALLALEAGEVDLISAYVGVPSADVERLMASDEFAVQSALTPRNTRLVFNFRDEAIQKHPWLDDVDVRKAFAHAIDRQGIVDTVWAGLTDTVWGPVPKAMDFYHNPIMDEMEPEYDPALAEQLLDDAGYERGVGGIRFSADVVFLPRGHYDWVLEIIKENLADVGIDLNIIVYEYSTWLETFSYAPDGLKDVPLAMFDGSVGPDPGLLNFYYMSTPAEGGQNNAFYNNTEAFNLLNLGSSVADPQERQQYYYDFAEVLAEDYMNVWLFNYFVSRAWNTEFAGFEEDYAGFPMGYGSLEKAYWTKGTSAPPETLEERVDALEGTISSLETEIAELAGRITDLLMVSYGAIGIAVIAIVMAVYVVFRRK